MTFEMRVVWDSLPLLLGGVWLTVVVSLTALAVGALIGLVVCAGTMLGRGAVYRLCIAYVSLFRTLPETVLIFWLYYCIPLVLDHRPTAFSSAVMALAIPAAAYFAEIFRAGIESVPHGQVEAARAMGLSPVWVLWDVIAPQALRTMIPPILGLSTIVIKNSALVSVIGVEELFYRATVYANQTFRYFETLTSAAVLFFLLILPLSVFVQLRERRLLTRSR
jgi:His/Glu/Gln/Arg/opine family amino acid ABC transporter permease subunit